MKGWGRLVALMSMVGVATPTDYYLNQYLGSSECMVGAPGQQLEVSAVSPSNSCRPWTGPGGGYRLFNLTADGSAVDTVRLNCSDAACTQCGYSAVAGPQPLDSCLPLIRSGGAYVPSSVAVYRVDRGICLSSLHGRSAVTGMFSADYGTVPQCGLPSTDDGTTVVLRQWGELSDAPKCQVDPVTNTYAALAVFAAGNLTRIQGRFDCPTAACAAETCRSTVNGFLDSCMEYNATVGNNITVSATIRFQNVATLDGCQGDPNPGSGGDGRNPNYGAIVIGATLGAFALVWTIVASLFCRQKRQLPDRGIQGDEVSSPLFSAETAANTSYNSITIDA